MITLTLFPRLGWTGCKCSAAMLTVRSSSGRNTEHMPENINKSQIQIQNIGLCLRLLTWSHTTDHSNLAAEPGIIMGVFDHDLNVRWIPVRLPKNRVHCWTRSLRSVRRWRVAARSHWRISKWRWGSIPSWRWRRLIRLSRRRNVWAWARGC